MGIPESQLETWSHQGATVTAKATHESTRRAFVADTSPIKDKDFEVYLQGSYKNDTNIRGDSDVDLVVQLNSTFQHDLSSLLEEERQLFQQSYPSATYLWQNFRSDVLQALRNYYGTLAISEGDKSLKVAGESGRLPADVVVCIQYRKYQSFRNTSNQKYVEGITFYSQKENRWIINFPKLHYEKGVTKNASTNGLYKPTVRLFKNARTYLVDHSLLSGDIAPSYFLECFIYNISNGQFGGNYQNTFLNAIRWLVDALGKTDFTFMCQNEQLPLFGNSQEQWSQSNAVEFLKKIIDLWQNWG